MENSQEISMRVRSWIVSTPADVKWPLYQKSDQNIQISCTWQKAKARIATECQEKESLIRVERHFKMLLSKNAKPNKAKLLNFAVDGTN